VDTSVVSAGTNIALAIDTSNNLHVAYFDSPTRNLYYGIKTGGAWTTAVIADPDYYDHVNGEPSLALDTNGYPAIAYLTDDNLRYAYFDGATWNYETIYDESADGKYPDFPSLELAGGDITYPNISFIDGDGYLRLASYGGMDPCPGTSEEYDCPYRDNASTYQTVTSLAMTGSELRSVIYMDAQTGVLHLQHETSSNTWNPHIVDHSYNTGLSSSLAVDSDGPHISYYDRDLTDFKYAEFDQSDPGGCGIYGFNTWFRCDTVADSAVVGSNDSVGIGYNYYPHVAYYDPTHPALRYATLNPTWSSIIIDSSSADTGRYPSLAFSQGTGYGRIAYMDVTNGVLKYAQEMPTPAGNCGPGYYWQCDPIDNIGQDGFGISLALNPSGYPLISFVDGQDDRVKVARYVGGSSGTCTNPAWNCESIAPEHPTGWGQTSIWADSPDGISMVSFHNSDDGTLMVSIYSYGSGWVHETADQAYVTGVENSITAIGTMPVVAYSDERYYDLNVAWKVGGGDGNCGEGANWYCETIDHTGRVGFSPSIKLDPSGRLYISYYDLTNGDLKLTFQALPSFLPLIKKP